MRLLLITLLILSSSASRSQADTSLIKKHLVAITQTNSARNHLNIETLDKTAQYIFEQFSIYADTTYFQEYQVNGNTYKNVVCVFDRENVETIVIGAHYDVCGNQEGADDNASGTVGLIELARLLSTQDQKHRIEIVAYTLEEPPYFRSDYMGSAIHAQSLKSKGTDVYGMVCLEMIGYYDDRKNTQDYPLGILKLFYGSKGNYITLVNKFGKGTFARKFNKRFKRQDLIRTKKFSGPKKLQGIDFSDHLNYWKLGYSALMITDTSFYRNKNYHEDGDRLETLNIQKMAEVINSTFHSVLRMK